MAYFPILFGIELYPKTTYIAIRNHDDQGPASLPRPWLLIAKVIAMNYHYGRWKMSDWSRRLGCRTLEMGALRA
jgi:hypothetical protein